MQDSMARDEAVAWGPLYWAGGAALLLIVGLIPAQILVYLLSPPPTTAAGFLAVFERSPLLGLLDLDLLYMLDILLMVPAILGLCVALRRASPSLTTLALAFGMLSTAIYFASNPAFEMLLLSNQHAAAPSEESRAGLRAASEALLATYKGTAFNVSYVLAGVSGLLVAIAMMRSDLFSRTTAYLGLAMNLLGLVPSTAGMVGLAASFLYLVPFLLWSILVSRRLFQLARGDTAQPPMQARVELPVGRADAPTHR